MIRLRFTKSYVGLGFAYQEDDEVDWQNVADAVRLIGDGTAEAVKGSGPASVGPFETATIKPALETPEPATAAKRGRRK